MARKRTSIEQALNHTFTRAEDARIDAALAQIDEFDGDAYLLSLFTDENIEQAAKEHNQHVATGHAQWQLEQAWNALQSVPSYCERIKDGKEEF